MTKNDAQRLLDSMLIPLDHEKNNIGANKHLKNKEKDLLLQIVMDFETQEKEYDLEKALEDIAPIMMRYVKKANKSTVKGTKIVIRPKPVPFLIQQVLFFIAVSCNVYQLKVSQKEIITKLNKCGVPISHNFFSRMHTTPVQYVSMIKYKQPELPADYMGKKHNELAVAIKNLVYQSGKYNIFCDIFGGSGAAVLAVDRRKDARYVYNELNRKVYNLFNVMTEDKMYLELIEELGQLQNDLEGKGIWLDDTEVDFYAEIERFQASGGKNGFGNRKTVIDEPEDFEIRYEDVVNGMKELYPSKTKSMEDSEYFLSFLQNYHIIIKYMKMRYGSNNIFVVKKKNNTIKLLDKIEDFKQYRFYKYYVFFSNLLNKAGEISSNDKVRYAVAEIFIRSLMTWGKIGLSEINKKTSRLDKFLKRSFEECITDIHKEVKGTICENMDCVDIIKKYQSGKGTTLFYSDSPYAETSDYTDEANGVHAFTPDNMKNLIYALRDSGDKFIFSCRAVKGSNTGSKTDKKLESANRGIFSGVFEHFLAQFFEKGQPLWILAIEKNGNSLEKLIKENKTAEIMITNFEIRDFVVFDQKYQNVNFKVYTFDRFLELLIDHANV